VDSRSLARTDLSKPLFLPLFLFDPDPAILRPQGEQTSSLSLSLSLSLLLVFCVLCPASEAHRAHIDEAPTRDTCAREPPVPPSAQLRSPAFPPGAGAENTADRKVSWVSRALNNGKPRAICGPTCRPRRMRRCASGVADPSQPPRAGEGYGRASRVRSFFTSVSSLPLCCADSYYSYYVERA